MSSNRSVSGRADGDPASDDEHLSIGEKRRADEWHAASDNPRRPFKFLDQITVVWIARNHPGSAWLAADRNVHQLIVRNIVVEIQSARGVATRARVALGAGRAAGAVCGFEDVMLDARKRRFESRRGAR